MGKGCAVFVDRDDTLMVDVVYCHDPDQVKILPGVAEGLRLLSEGGFRIVVVTNQSGIGRGYFGERELQTVNARLRQELRARGADFHALYYCPHRPDEGCFCRKPRPGLILRATSELNLDVRSSYTVGDREWDILAGKAAGTQTILLSDDMKFEGGARNLDTKADFVAKDVEDAAHLILKLSSMPRSRSP